MSTFKQHNRGSLPALILCLFLPISAGIILTACDQIISPADDTELENPKDPESDVHVAPETSIISAPEEGSTVTTSVVTFEYSGNDDGMLFQWQLNSDGWSGWNIESSVTLAYLEEGSYTFEVRGAYDPGSGGYPTDIDDSPAVVNFIVDAIHGASLWFSPLYVTVPRGIDFEMHLVAEEVSDLMAVRAVIRYDTSILEALEVEDGTFLTSTGGSLVSYHSIDSESGTIEINIGTAAGTPIGVSGTGTVCRILFRGIVSQESEITFDTANTLLRDHLNQVVTINYLVGALVVIGP